MEKNKYLKLLSSVYRNINSANVEIINLQAILFMPKGTEHFLSDVHGAYDAFNHVIRNASGVIKNYIEELFGNTLMDQEKKQLEILVYYPEDRLAKVKRKERDMPQWYKINLIRLLKICKRVSSKYTRSKVRKALPPDFSYILEELIHEDAERRHKQNYYYQIIDTIIKLDAADDFMISIAYLIQRLAVDHLHIIGDIYDRGNGASKIIDLLENYHSLDIQWGNHDMAWMGAASGCDALICNTIRTSIKYGALDMIEEAYGINQLPLATFAMDVYKDDPCDCFLLSPKDTGHLQQKEIDLLKKMHKAISIIQFKKEAEIIARRPEYRMDDRILFDKIDPSTKTVAINNKIYELKDKNFPTIDFKKPMALSKEEREVMEKLRNSFVNSRKLNDHVKFLFNKGSMYKVFNNNLLFHGCIPMTKDGEFKAVRVCGKNEFRGKALLDKMESLVKKGFYGDKKSEEKIKGQDMMWYLWCGKDSPLFGKDKMTTFERHFFDDKSLWEEGKDPYYSLRESEEICSKILEEFGVEARTGRIINGHVPVKAVAGENPVKANGKLIDIDGGFSKAYQSVTGIAGYTLISNSQGLLLTAHNPFVSKEDAIRTDTDIFTKSEYVERYHERRTVGDTDIGREIQEKILGLLELLKAYKNGEIQERK